jgi:PhoD-like phosphatase
LIAQIDNENKTKVAAANNEKVRAFKERYVKAAQERIKVASRIEPRKYEDLREEERIVVYRKLIQELLAPTKIIPMPDDKTHHIVAELLDSIFDVEKMANCFNNRGLGCDNWATNSTSNNETFVRERASFLKFLDDNNIKNVVFVATDVHFAANVRVVQDFNGDGDNLIFYELVSGPLTTYTRDVPNPLDPTINAKYLYSENAIFNFGYLRLQPDPKVHDKIIHLFYDVRDIDGRERPNSFLNLAPQ